MRGVLHHKEELAAGAVREHRTCHRENTARVAQIVFKTIVRKLAADRIAGASHAGALRIAALNHKAGNDTVKNGAVVKTLFDERDKIVDRIRGNLRVQLNLDFAVVCFNGDNRIFHV